MSTTQTTAPAPELLHRTIPAGPARVAVFRRTYAAAVEDVWEACTDPERLRRWYVPVTGELTLAGVTRPVQTEIAAVRTAEGVDVSGSVPVTFADHGIDAPSLGFVRVEDQGAVEFLVRLTR